MPERLPALLVLDDEEMVRENLQAYLEDEGFSVIAGGSAEEALELLKSHDVDLCIVDMRLPGASGNEFILRANGVNPELRFIIHTGSTNYKLPAELKDIGVERDHVFIKPVKDMQHLVRAIITQTT